MPAGASLVTADATTADAQAEGRGRRRRRRRGRGGRGADGETAVGADKSSGAEDLTEDDDERAEQAPVAIPVAAVGPAIEPVVEAPRTHEGNGQSADSHEVAVTTPDMIVLPTTTSLPLAASAPMPVEQLEAVLQLAGLSLVQTEPAKLNETQARLAAEPRPARLPRERPVLPPLEEGPLVQVETRSGQSPVA